MICNRNVTFFRLLHSHNHLQQRCLSGSVNADDANLFSLLQGKGSILKQLSFRIGFRHILYINQIHAFASFYCPFSLLSRDSVYQYHSVRRKLVNGLLFRIRPASSGSRSAYKICAYPKTPDTCKIHCIEQVPGDQADLVFHIKFMLQFSPAHS